MKKIASILLIIGLGVFGMSLESRASFGFENVITKARTLAAEPYTSQKAALPEKLASMDYDDFRSLRFVRENGPWYGKNLPFEIQFFHMGSIFENAVTVNEVFNGEARKIPYSSKYFTLNDKPLEGIANIGYAGFRLHYPLNTASYHDELVSFLGASYFRALGADQKYGLSARGLAIDTGLQTGEEFPVFKEFWIERPMKRKRNITIYALLDSPSVTGAYSFFIIPGATTRMQTKAVLFPRKTLTQVGIAPLTSMYLFGENTKNKFDDYRPEVHDSDAFLTHNANGEWVFRPLDNAKTLRISSFVDDNVQGFGLLQRDRNPDHYQDFEAHYQDRPSVWITPDKPFGKGMVKLVEIPSDKEIHDNVVAFFVPDKPLEKGREYLFEYTINWFKNQNPMKEDVAKVISTRTGVGGVSGVPRDDLIKFVIDFRGKELNKISNVADLTPMVEASVGDIKDVVVIKNPLTGGYRLVFDFKPASDLSELRASLWQEDKLLSEVWSYPWLR